LGGIYEIHYAMMVGFGKIWQPRSRRKSYKVGVGSDAVGMVNELGAGDAEFTVLDAGSRLIFSTQYLSLSDKAFL